MSTTSLFVPSIHRGRIATIITAGSTLAVVDGFCAFAINALFFNQPSFAHTFQGVAAALLGKEAFTLGVAGVLLGIAMHVAVAFTWTTLYLIVYRSWPALMRATSNTVASAGVGMVLGAVIWCSMCIIVFPMTKIGHVPLASRTFVINLIQHVLVVGPLIVAVDR